MKQFDVYLNPIAKGAALYPYVCSLQSELLDGLSTRVMYFVTHDANIAFDKVSVPVAINGTEYHLCMNVVATIENNRLKDFVCNVSALHNHIVNAYATLLIGI